MADASGTGNPFGLSDADTLRLAASRLRELDEQATRAPWERRDGTFGLWPADGSVRWVTEHIRQRDAALVVALRNVAPRLVDVLEHAADGAALWGLPEDVLALARAVVDATGGAPEPGQDGAS